MNDTDAELSKGFRLGDCIVEPQRERVTVNGQTHHLEPKVMRVLLELATHAQQPVAREALLDSVWADVVVGEEVLSRAISLLRTTLGDERTDPKYIRTIPRQGYELIVPVEPLQPAPRTMSLKSVVGLLGVVVFAVVLATLGWFGRSVEPKVLVMMPMTVADGELGGIAKGLSDALHDLVSSAAGVQMVARSWSFAVRDPDGAPQGIAEQFGADYVLEGALDQPAIQYELVLELVDAINGHSLWRQRFSAPDAQALAAVALDEVRQALNTRIDADIATLPATRAPLNAEAYRAYLQARHHWSLRGGEHMERATTLLKQSIKLDPEFAAARLALAQVVALEPFYSTKPVLTQFAQAREHLQTAVEANASLTSQAQALEGFMRLRSRDWQGAQDMLMAALHTDPNNALAHYWMSMYLGAIGDYSGSHLHAARAVELEPATPVLRDRLAITYLWLDDVALAQQEFVRAEELGFALDFRSKAYLLFLYRTQRFDELARLLANMQLPKDWVAAFVAGLRNENLRQRAVDVSEAAMLAGSIPEELRFGVWVLLQEGQRALDSFDYSLKSPDVEFLWAKECAMLRDLPGYNVLSEKLELSDALRISLKKQRDSLP